MASNAVRADSCHGIHHHRLQQCFQQRAVVDSPAVKRTRRENQGLESFAQYFSRKNQEVLALGDRSKSTHDKIGIVAARMVKIHLWLPSEQAIKAVMQAAVAAGFVRQEDERIGIVRSIKGALKQRTKAKSKSLQLPTPMPSHPNQLPAEIFEAAYPAE